MMWRVIRFWHFYSRFYLGLTVYLTPEIKFDSSEVQHTCRFQENLQCCAIRIRSRRRRRLMVYVRIWKTQQQGHVYCTLERNLEITIIWQNADSDVQNNAFRYTLNIRESILKWPQMDILFNPYLSRQKAHWDQTSLFRACPEPREQYQKFHKI